MSHLLEVWFLTDEFISVSSMIHGSKFYNHQYRWSVTLEWNWISEILAEWNGNYQKIETKFTHDQSQPHRYRVTSGNSKIIICQKKKVRAKQYTRADDNCKINELRLAGLPEQIVLKLVQLISMKSIFKYFLRNSSAQCRMFIIVYNKKNYWYRYNHGIASRAYRRPLCRLPAIRAE